MKEASDTSPIAFRLGQVDALAKTLLASPALYSAEMRASLALHWLSRAWQQYREDRAITLGPALILATLALMAGGVTMMSPLPMAQLYGKLVVQVLAAALIGDILFLPALIAVVESWRRKRT